MLTPNIEAEIIFFHYWDIILCPHRHRQSRSHLCLQHQWWILGFHPETVECDSGNRQLWDCEICCSVWMNISLWTLWDSSSDIERAAYYNHKTFLSGLVFFQWRWESGEVQIHQQTANILPVFKKSRKEWLQACQSTSVPGENMEKVTLAITMIFCSVRLWRTKWAAYI